MTNVISISCTCDYLVKRAARHRRSGRYDEAMTLLWKARNQFGLQDDILWEMAQLYDEMGCDDDAERTYLRLVRIRGKHRPEALFHLAITSAQRGDLQRASSYFESFGQHSSCESISQEMAEVFARQLEEERLPARFLSARKRAAALEKRAAASLQAGRVAAAQRAMEHALRLHPTARGYTMLACCQLLRLKLDDALESAKAAHAISPSNVQAMCVLSDVYMALGQRERAVNVIYMASLRAKEIDDLLAVCVESAKAGCDTLTLKLTGRMLKLSPYHTRAMMMRACALINRSQREQAVRLLARLCGLLPENTVCQSYYRLMRDGYVFAERLSLGTDVIREDGIKRAAELMKLLYEDPKTIDEDDRLCQHICRVCDWAFYSPMAGPSTKMTALVLLAGLQSDEAKGVLQDLLLSPHVSDSLKLSALQVLTARDGFYPYDVDMGGKLVRLAAGGVSTEAVHPREANSRVVQRVADRLLHKYGSAAKKLLDAYLAYLQTYPQPDKKHESACAAALEYWYLCSIGKKVCEEEIAASYGITMRMLRIYANRFETCMAKQG